MLECEKEEIGASEVGCYWLDNMLTVGWVIDTFTEFVVHENGS